MISKVLVPVDGSQNSLRAAEHALELMKMNRYMEMTILNVVPSWKTRRNCWHSGFPGKAMLKKICTSNPK